MGSRPRNLASGAALHLMVLAIWLALILVRAFEPRLSRAVSGFEATYCFRQGRAARLLSFSAGRISTRRGVRESPADYEITFIDLPGAVRHLRKRPNDLLTLMATNKITRSGNDHYLFKLGYMLGVCESGFRDLRSRLHPFEGIAGGERGTDTGL